MGCLIKKEGMTRLLRQASIWHYTVVSSSKLNLALVITLYMCVLKHLTAASHNPGGGGGGGGLALR